MKIIKNSNDLNGHNDACFVKNSLDGSTSVICSCEETKSKREHRPTAQPRVAPKTQTVVASKVEVPTENEELNFNSEK